MTRQTLLQDNSCKEAPSPHLSMHHLRIYLEILRTRVRKRLERIEKMPQMNYLDSVVHWEGEVWQHVVGFAVALKMKKWHDVQQFWIKVVRERYDVVAVVEICIQQILFNELRRLHSVEAFKDMVEPEA